MWYYTKGRTNMSSTPGNPSPWSVEDTGGNRQHFVCFFKSQCNLLTPKWFIGRFTESYCWTWPILRFILHLYYSMLCFCSVHNQRMFVVLCMLSSNPLGFYFEGEEKGEATFRDYESSDEFLWPDDVSEWVSFNLISTIAQLSPIYRSLYLSPFLIKG